MPVTLAKLMLVGAAVLSMGCGRPQQGCSSPQDRAPVTVYGVTLIANSSTAVRGGGSDMLFLSADNDACAAFYGKGVALYAPAWLQVIFATPNQPGQYVAGRALFDPLGFAADAEASVRGNVVALTGSIALTSVPPPDEPGADPPRDARLVGDYDLVFPTNERMTGHFSAPYCENCIQ